ncbi:MAG: phosphotransferase enzyme family protein [Paracoccaceae bacterium]
MNDEQAHAVAVAALANWGGAAHAPRLIGNRENAVFEATLADGAHVALRLHRPGYQTDAAIRSELIWMQALAGSGFRCCAPVPTLSGALTVRAGDRVVSAVGWVNGAPLGASGVPPARGKTANVGLFEALGAMIARLHTASDELVLPADFERPSWDEDGLLGQTPLWGRFWENPALDAPEQDLLLQVREKAARELSNFRNEGADFGLIHADVLRENVLIDESGLVLIDFDDCGFGFRMYDLGVALVQVLQDAQAPSLSRALIAGYQSERSLPDRAISQLQLFVMLRAFASCGWIISRAAPGDARQRLFAQKALDCASEFLCASD